MKVKARKRKRKILNYQNKLYVTFLVSILVPVAILILGIMFYTNYVLNKREQMVMENMVDSVSRNIEMQIQEVINIRNLYYTDAKVFREVEYLNKLVLYQYYDELSKSQMEREYSLAIMQMVYAASQPVRSVVFFPADERSCEGYYLGKEQSSIQMVSYVNYHEEAWYLEAVANLGDVIVYGIHCPDYFQNKEEKPVYSCVSAIRDMNNGWVIGVVKIDVSPKYLQESLEVANGTDKQGFILS